MDRIPEEGRPAGGGAAGPCRRRDPGAGGEGDRSLASRGAGGGHLGAASLALVVAVAGCGGGAGGDGTPAPPPTLAAVGDALFHDPSLSANGQLACASCHAPERAHTDPAGTFLPVGGVNLDQNASNTGTATWAPSSSNSFWVSTSVRAP